MDERHADPVRADEADEVLAVAADVEQATAEREGDGEAGQDQRRRLQQRLAEVVRGGLAISVSQGCARPVQAGAVDDVPVGLNGLWPVAATTIPPIRNATRAVITGDDPARALPRREPRRRCQGGFLADLVRLRAVPAGRAARSRRCRPPRPFACRRASRSRSRPRSPPTCAPRRSAPSYMTRMRSESESISSSSSETSRIARPSSRSSTSRRCTNSIAPTSRPRVGCAAISTFGSRSISRAATTFCWLPPERPPARVCGPPPRTSNSLISSRARSTRRFGKSQPKRDVRRLVVVVQRDVLGDREVEHEPAALPVLGDVADARRRASGARSRA